MRRNTLGLALRVVVALALAGRVAIALDVDPNRRDQVVAYLQESIANDEAIIAFYQKVDSWDRMRELRRYEIPITIWNHLADARTHLVKRLYAEVHAEIYEHDGVYFDDPRKETHFIGTPPSDPNFKGVLSDLDVGMFLDPNIDPKKSNAGLTLPERQVLQIKAKRLMEAKLGAYGPDSGFLFDTNLYTTPEMFGEGDIGPIGVRELEYYDDVLAYLAIRVGCESNEARWLDLKHRLLTHARAKDGLERRVRTLIESAEKHYAEYERLRSDAIAAAEKAGREVYPGLDDQAVTRHFEDRMLAFIQKHGKELAADDADGQALRTQYNKAKADYEASLRESYFTFAAQTFIVRWKLQTEEQKQKFLSDPNKVRRVRADQARFILHYLQHPPGTEGEALRFKVQKIAKYEQRALNVLRAANRRLFVLPGFDNEQVLELFTAMKGQSTPSEAWFIWRAWNYNRLLKRDPNATIPEADLAQAEEYAIQRAKAYLEHIEEKLIDIATELPSFSEN